MSNLFKNEILLCRSKFEDLLDKMEQTSSKKDRLRLGIKAISKAVRGETGYYSCDKLERFYLQIAQEAKTPNPLPEKEDNSFLHVMTLCYAVGGHTRVVERWIELSEKNQKHSLIFTAKENQPIPERLAKAVKDKGGEIIRLPDSLDEEQKGLALREIASRYATVILHVHMHDTAPLIAFGTEEFERPVLFFNHADHRFWLGASIADKILDIRSWGMKLTRERRGLSESVFLGIPVDIAARKDPDKDALRVQLGLPQDKKIVLTLGAPHKYRPLGEMDFSSTAQKILLADPDILMLAIGPTLHDLPNWEKIVKTHGNRFRALGYKQPKELYDYIGASDLVIDSFPMSGGTALIDAVSLGRPVLSLDCPTGQLDYITQTDSFCKDEAELLQKTALLLNDPEKARALAKTAYEALQKSCGSEEWSLRLKEIYKTAQTMEHKVTLFKTPPKPSLSWLDDYLFLYAIRKKTRGWTQMTARIKHLFSSGSLLTRKPLDSL